jgi:hypothetical protein
MEKSPLPFFSPHTPKNYFSSREKERWNHGFLAWPVKKVSVGTDDISLKHLTYFLHVKHQIIRGKKEMKPQVPESATNPMFGESNNFCDCCVVSTTWRLVVLGSTWIPRRSCIASLFELIAVHLKVRRLGVAETNMLMG